MRLTVKIKHKIILDLGKKDKPVTIQTIGPNVIHFKLLDLHAFSNDDIKYILATVPEYEEFQNAIEAYVDKLEGDKANVLEKLKGVKHRLMDMRPVDCKIKLETKIDHWIQYNAYEENEYNADFLTYDSAENNLLYKV